ncbi:GerAB/ArcD/ProY family transporter [Bacillus dakarensis]|uniref:GerAB/ArcD/ProY family transporter n=1 Tax=Robertmurraya dakarensis TaxID=1926278 RepID=UPI000981446B|nr:GerAB/ArcD/ProY family transporter [Bacillus dakarensis]
MENVKISSFQLFTLIYIFILGTTVIFPVGADAKQAAWISIFFGLLSGLPLLLMYYYLNKQYTNLLLTEYCIKILGKYIGTMIGILYILFFLYGAARDVRDVMELTPLFLYGTPSWAIAFMLILPILYGLYLGIEVIGRTSEIFFPYIVLTVILVVVFVIFSDLVKIENLRPITEPGWETVLRTTRKEAWMAPFGEMICFTMIFAYLKKPKLILKVGVAGVVSSGLVLVLIHILIFSVLGSEARNTSIAPLLRMVQKINIGDIIQRLDAFFMIWLIVNVYFKVTVFMYAAVIGGATIFKVSKSYLVIPSGLIVFITSIFIAGSYTAHYAQSDFVLKNVYPIFAVYIPLLLCVVTFVRNKIKKRKPRSAENF